MLHTKSRSGNRLPSRSVVFLVCLFLLSATASIAFAQEKSGDQSDIHHYFSKIEHKHDAPWGYKGDLGPQHWAELSPRYVLAKQGKRQSPIDIRLSGAVTEPLPKLDFAYNKERISMINNGHTIQHDDGAGSHLRVGGKKYRLEQFHFHVPSEHTFDGRHADMEVHFVHRSDEGKIAVVALMVHSEAEKKVTLPIHRVLPKKSGEQIVVDDIFVNPRDYLPQNHEYLSYSGSFTTPPCTEDIHWIVLKNPVGIAPRELASFREIIGGNNRPVQKLFDRQVLVDSREKK